MKFIYTSNGEVEHKLIARLVNIRCCCAIAGLSPLNVKAKVSRNELKCLNAIAAVAGLNSSMKATDLIRNGIRFFGMRIILGAKG